MGHAPPGDLPAPKPAISLSTPDITFCPTIPLPKLSFSLGIGGGSIGSNDPLVSGGFGVGGGVSFPPSLVKAIPCGFCISLPKFSLSFLLPKFSFPPLIPIPFLGLSLTLSCDLSKPISVSAGIRFGGGRVPNHDRDADLSESP